MPTYLFYPRRADGVSLTFIAEAARDDRDALELAGDIATAHDCVGVFIWEPSATEGRDRFVGQVERPNTRASHESPAQQGAAATV